MVDLRDALDKVDKIVLRANGDPVLGEKHDIEWRNELLERPSTAKPPALVEGGVLGMMVLSSRDIGEGCVADLCEAVPLVHGVDGFGKLETVLFVDAARVNPDVAVAVVSCDAACFLDLWR